MVRNSSFPVFPPVCLDILELARCDYLQIHYTELSNSEWVFSQFRAGGRSFKFGGNKTKSTLIVLFANLPMSSKDFVFWFWWIFWYIAKFWWGCVPTVFIYVSPPLVRPSLPAKHQLTFWQHNGMLWSVLVKTLHSTDIFKWILMWNFWAKYLYYFSLLAF